MSQLRRHLPRSAMLAIAALIAAPLVADDPPTTWPIDDFDDADLVAAPGLAWMALADDLIGGASHAELALIRGAGDRGRGLRVRGRLADGQPFAFAGAWTALRADGGGVDLSAFRGLSLSIRSGSTRTASVGLRPGGGQINFMASIEVGTAWRRVEIAFDDLQPIPPSAEARWQPESVTWLGITGAGGRGDFELEVDDVALIYAPQAGASVRRYDGSLVGALPAARWTDLASDEAGDGSRPRLPDARGLAWATVGDRVWFRAELAGAWPSGWLGMNVALDVDGDLANGMAWWGTNQDLRFDLLVTAYLTHVVEGWQGTVGLADAEAVGRGDMSAASRDVLVAREGSTLAVGVLRDVVPAGTRVRLIATVGSSMLNNDDVPSAGAVALTWPPAGDAVATETP